MGALREAERQRTDRDAAAGERAHERLEAAARIAEQVLVGHEAVLEVDGHRVGALETHLLLARSGAESVAVSMMSAEMPFTPCSSVTAVNVMATSPRSRS